MSAPFIKSQNQVVRYSIKALEKSGAFLFCSFVVVSFSALTFGVFGGKVRGCFGTRPTRTPCTGVDNTTPEELPWLYLTSR